MIPISAITAAIGLASQGLGAIKGAAANKKQQAFLNQRIADNEAAFNLDAHQDFLDTNAAKSMVEKLRKDLKKRDETTDSKGEITGATAEQKIAEKTSHSDRYNDSLSRLAGMATQYQDRAKYRFERNKNHLDNIQMQLNREKAQNASNLMGIGSSLLGTAGTLAGFGDFKGSQAKLDKANDVLAISPEIFDKYPQNWS